MKILHLLPYIPTPPDFGGALRIHYILEHLSNHHEVTVAAFRQKGDPARFVQTFPRLTNAYFEPLPLSQRFQRLFQFYSLFTGHSYWYVSMISRNMQRRIDRLLEENTYDIILVEFPLMGFFDLKCDAVKILDAHNVEYDNFRRMADINSSKIRGFFYRREYRKFYREEIAVCRRQEAIFTTSTRDQQILDEDVPKIPKFIIPNGVDLSYFHPSNDEPEPHSLVFTGMMGYVPNYEGMLYFLDDILPLIKNRIPDVKVYIVGKQPPEILRDRSSENVIVTGFVEDVRPYVWRSGVYIVPLTMGGGTRLKVLEALAMKKPVVTTSIGSEGINVRHEEEVLIADDPESFAEAVIRLIKDKALRRSLTQRGYELMKEEYTWSVIGNHIEDAFSKIMDGKTHKQKVAT
jgi:glycosyltransferase involved in cell wall biosynthesis